MSAAKMRYLSAISPKAAEAEASTATSTSSAGPGPHAQPRRPRPDDVAPAAMRPPSSGASLNSFGDDRMGKSTAEMTSPSMATSSDLNVHVASAGSTSTSSGAASTRSKRSKALEARMTAAMAIYAAPASDSRTLISDDDYFTADGTLDVDKLDGVMGDGVAGGGSITPTNAINAARTGAPPPPTLGEIEKHMMPAGSAGDLYVVQGQDHAEDQARGADADALLNTGTTSRPSSGTVGSAGAGFFEESFAEAFPSAEGADSFVSAGSSSADIRKTRVDATSTTANTRNATLRQGGAIRPAETPSTTAGTTDQLFLHDPFGAMPSLPTPSPSETAGGAAIQPSPISASAAAAAPSPAESSTTSVAARRRARANLVVDTRSGPTYSSRASPQVDSAQDEPEISPASMLDFALQGTPVSSDFRGSEGVPSADFGRNQGGCVGGDRVGDRTSLSPLDEKEGKSTEETHTTIGMQSPRNTDNTAGPGSRDDRSPKQLLESPRQVSTNSEEKKKKNFLSKMISRGKKGKRSNSTPKTPVGEDFIGAEDLSTPDAAEVTKSPAASSDSATSPTAKSPHAGSSTRAVSSFFISGTMSGPPTETLAARKASNRLGLPEDSFNPIAVGKEDSGPVDDDPPLLRVNDTNVDDSSDEDNLVQGANKLATAMIELRSVTTSDVPQTARDEIIPLSATKQSGPPHAVSKDSDKGGGFDRRPITPPPNVQSPLHDEVEATRSPGRNLFDELSYSGPLDEGPMASSTPKEDSPESINLVTSPFSRTWEGRTLSERVNPPSTERQGVRKDSTVPPRETSSGRGLRTLSAKKSSRQQGPTSSTAVKPPSILKKSGELRREVEAQYNLDDSNIDPIQRAGIRLLSAAAIPIQTEARRYLAQREAINRLRALVLIQAYFRRWRSQRMLEESIVAASLVQALFRGWLSRDTLEDQHYCATQLQRVVRGYIANMRVYNILSDLNMCQKATAIQSAWRGYAAQLSYQFDIVDVIIVQSIARRKAAYWLAAEVKQQRREQAATKISSTWRSYDCTMNYLHTLADILIAQSIVRRWIAVRAFPAFREHRLNDSATRIQKVVRGHISRNQLMWYFTATEIQSCWRRYSAMQDYDKKRAAMRIQRWSRGCVARREQNEKRADNASVIIQRNWRAYVCHTDFIFTVADIVITQRTARHWLAVRRVTALRDVAAATKIQSHYRAHSCHMTYLYTLVNIIIVQSVVRRRLIVKDYARQLMEQNASVKVQAAWRGYAARTGSGAAIAKRDAAVVLQKFWRGYWEFSSFVLLRHGIVQTQALVRGYQERDWLKFQHECASVIQSGARSYVVRNMVKEQKGAMLAANAVAAGTRMKNAASKIQLSWRNFSRSVTEKKAALVIERFFIAVKEEVDREMARIELSKKEKRQKKRRKKKEQEDKLLERVWLNTVRSEHDNTKGVTEKKKNVTASTKNKKVSNRNGVALKEHKREKMEGNDVRGSSDAFPPASTIHADDDSEVSGITSPSVFTRDPTSILPSPSRFKNLSRKELRDDLSLEEAWIDTEVHKAKEKMRTEKLYITKYGLDRSGGSIIASRRNKSTTFPPDEKKGSSQKSMRHGPSHTSRCTGRGSSS